MNSKSLLIIISVAIVIFCGCGKKPLMDTSWSSPQKFASTDDSFITNFSVHYWNGRFLALLQPGLDEKANLSVYFLTDDGTSWIQNNFPRIDGDFLWFPLANPIVPQVVFSKLTLKNGELKAMFALNKIDPVLGINLVSEGNLLLDPNEFWNWSLLRQQKDPQHDEEERPLLEKFGPPRFTAYMFQMGKGIIRGAQIVIPFTVEGSRQYGEKKVIVGDGPYGIGLLVSSDSGTNWTAQNVFSSRAFQPSIIITKNKFYVLFSKSDGSLNLIEGTGQRDGWSEPKKAVDSFVSSTRGKYVVHAQDEIIHLCWLDKRHEKKRLSFFNAGLAN